MRRLSPLLAAALLVGCSGETESGAPTTAPTTDAATSGATTTGPAPTGPLRLRLERVAAGLAAPTHVASTPSEPTRLYVVEQGGTIRVLEGGEFLERPFLDISRRVRAGGEQGLLSVAFHPEYEENRLFYVNYTDTAGDTRVVEYVPGEGGSPPRRSRELLHVDQPYANHNGGQLAFGPDGRLYVGMGDGGSAGDPENRAQDLGDLLGKLLALDVDEGSTEWQIVGYGLRNPWRFSFDRETGDLWIGDVGQSGWEEIDWIPRSSRGLENYGWDIFEGRHLYEDKDLNRAGRLVTPVAEYSHDLGCSVTGGFPYRGDAIPAAGGRYFYGDFCSGRIWSLALRGGKARDVREHRFEVPSLASFGEDAAGELYLVSLDGEIFRLEPR
jgi:glucose/arabinose dehydrogenase